MIVTHEIFKNKYRINIDSANHTIEKYNRKIDKKTDEPIGWEGAGLYYMSVGTAALKIIDLLVLEKHESVDLIELVWIYREHRAAITDLLDDKKLKSLKH